MPVIPEERTVYTLAGIAEDIRQTLAGRYPGMFWVRAEMNKLNRYPQSGHCYPDLVERSAGKIVAEMRAVIWKDDYQRINDHFLSVLGAPLKEGVALLLQARIAYSPVYGLSLRILDIDPSWTLGELEKEKRETIARLKREGLFDRNRMLTPALLPGRIAVISVETSKGYADFRSLIDGNTWGYNIFHMLFPALLQGDQAVASITGQLERIRSVAGHFDAVAIIRGGGGDVGLTCYNHYELARAVALFPIPVITGIGHSTNETVTEMVAFRNAITPTDLAGYILQAYHNYSVPLKKAEEVIVRSATRILADEKRALATGTKWFSTAAGAALERERYRTGKLARVLATGPVFVIRAARQRIMLEPERVHSASNRLIASNRHFLSGYADGLQCTTDSHLMEADRCIAGLEKQIALLDPVNILRRGYSITLSGGVPVTSITGINEGAPLVTRVADGTITSKAISVHSTTKDDQGT